MIWIKGVHGSDRIRWTELIELEKFEPDSNPIDGQGESVRVRFGRIGVGENGEF